MTLHLLKLVWRRKRANALVAVEIFFSFLVIFAVVTGGVALISGWRHPLGFSWDDVWMVQVNMGESIHEPREDDDPQRATMARLLRETKAFPQVVEAALSDTPAYGFATSEGIWKIDGKDVPLTRDEVTDGFRDVMKLTLLRGRWFSQSDDALGFRPVVIDADLARALYGNADPIGKKFDDNGRNEDRVVGVIAPYRKNGEISAPNVDMVFFRKSLNIVNGRVPRNLLIRVKPGTDPAFEAQLAARLHSVMPDASFEIQRMEAMRESMNRARISPLIVLGIVALFLILMVALGLTGVLWQNVTRRTREIGLRRAVGASGLGVRSQILGEVALLATLAVVIGLVVVMQLPLLGIFALVTPSVYAAGVVAALAVIYGVTLACGLYPSWLASRLQPAEALRYE